MLQFVQAFILLFVIMDPLVSLAAFLPMTKRLQPARRSAIATKAVMVAAIPLFLFILGGDFLLELLRVDLSTFKAAGGLILILLGIQLSLGLHFPKDEDMGSGGDGSAIASVIGTPLITGPATVSTAIILSGEMGQIVTAASGVAALFAVWLCLQAGARIYDRMGITGISVLSTMMGIITLAWGVSFIKEGLL